MKSRRKCSNEPEEACAQELERMGYRPSKRGWPDFVAFCASNGRPPIVVEVKPDRQHLKREQAAVMCMLAEAGIACYRWDPVDGLQPWSSASQDIRVALSRAQAKQRLAQWRAQSKAQRRAEKKRRKRARQAARRAPLPETVDAPLWRLA